MRLWRSRPRLARPARLAQPPDNRRYLVPLALLLLLLLGGWLWQREPSAAAPDELREWVLTGPRPAGCLRLILAADISGSMSGYASAREAALQDLVEWVQQDDNLRRDDELAVADFAGDAAVRLAPVRLGSRPSAPPTGSAPDGSLLRPLVDTVAQFPRTDCYTALLLVSDGELFDLPSSEDAGIRILRQAGVDEIRLLVPGRQIRVPPGWQRAFPAAAPQRFDGVDRDETAIVFGQTVADLVNQRLVPRQGS